MNDHRNHRYRESEPAWPSGDDPGKPREEAPERTGFWSPLWEEDDDEPSGRQHGAGRNGHSGSHSNGHTSGGHHAREDNNNGGGSHARAESNGAGHRWPESGSHAAPADNGHRWPDAEPPAGRRAEPPPPPAQPRPAPRSGGPAWPGADPSPGTPPRRGGPHTPPPGLGLPNGAPGPGGPGRPPAGPTTRIVRPRPGGPSGPGRPGGPGGPGAVGMPGVDPEGPTELIPSMPPRGGNGPEPQLLTHREPDYDEDLNDDPDLDADYYDEDDDGPPSDDDRKRRRKKVWRRVRRAGYVFTALMIIGPVVAFFVAYQMVEVPKPEQLAAKQGQVVTVTYGNGDLMSKIVPQDGNRTMVRYDQLPDVVKHAVFAAEDGDFMTNPGFDISGVLRAGWNQVSGGDGGGSTITQQYIKKATGEEDATLSRKGLEIVKAYKMNNTYDKEDIITAYLNTIYFGRGAWGIVAAGQAYYGKNLDELSASQAALLAGMIQNPARDADTAYREQRWSFVMNQMEQRGWVSAEERAAAQPPTLIPREQSRPQAVTGPNAHIQWAAIEEVKRETGLTIDDLRRYGYTVQTTIDPNAQQLAINALNEVMGDQPKNLLPAMVAISPKTGDVLAYYGGYDGTGLDWAQQAQEPGSSFKPFDLVALLEKGKGLYERYDGTSGRTIGGRKVRNSGGASCGEQCTVAEAMERSINTVFYDMALNDVGTQKVADAAKQAGIMTPLVGENGGPPDANISIGGGKTLVSTYEMASAYATFAANGTYRAPHIVSKVLDQEGNVVWEPAAKDREGKPAFDAGNLDRNKQIARNVTESLKPVLGYSKLKCANGRECAGKTGTHQFGATEDNAKAWMVGYTPQVSVAVSLAAEENNKQVPLKNSKGDIVYGSGLPGKVWKHFMDAYLKDLPKEGFGKFEPIGKAEKPKGDEDGERDRDRDRDDDNTSQTQTQTQTQTEPSGPGTEPSEPEGPGGGGPGGTDPSEPEEPGGGPLPTLGWNGNGRPGDR